MSNFIKYPQKTIAILFGYKGLKKTVTRNVQIVKNNRELKCKVCGRIQDEGYIDNLNTLLQVKSNDTYSHFNILSPFLCGYCHYIQSNYSKRLQNPPINNIGDIVIFPNKYEIKDFKTNSCNNDLLKLFLKPPKTPYYILLKEQITSNTIVNMVHTIKPTLDNKIIIVNYGLHNYVSPREKTLECLENAVTLLERFNNINSKLTAEVLFNSTKHNKYDLWFSHNLRKNNNFMIEYSKFINNYTEDIRKVAKIMLLSYKKIEGN